ncbi:MAG: hypothetical protein QHJ73_02490 [Armatimonadota bacterium]|nr:hypothetical protein [Armatimonadota bacterium]
MRKVWLAAHATGMFLFLCWAAASPQGGSHTNPGTKPDTVHGIVKGQPVGTTFVVARKGGEVKVDASKAKIREREKTATFSVIRPGLMVTAKGKMEGKVLKAEEVIAFPIKRVHR